MLELDYWRKIFKRYWSLVYISPYEGEGEKVAKDKEKNK